MVAKPIIRKYGVIVSGEGVEFKWGVGGGGCIWGKLCLDDERILTGDFSVELVESVTSVSMLSISQ